MSDLSFLKKASCTFITLLFCATAFCNPADSANVPERTKIYRVNRPIVGAIIAVGLATDYFAIDRIKSKDAITDDQIAGLDKGSINSFDRIGVNQNASQRDQYKQMSDISEIAMILMPGLLAFNKNIRKDWWDLILMYAEGHTITFTFYNYSPLGPTFNDRYRPMTYYTEFPIEERQKGNNRNSFYSGHVASASYSTFFMAKVWCDYHPDMGATKYLIYTAAALPPLAMAYMRVKALDHFPSDNAVGLALGAAVGIIVPQLHKFRSKDISLGLSTSPDAMGLSICWKIGSKK